MQETSIFSCSTDYVVIMNNMMYGLTCMQTLFTYRTHDMGDKCTLWYTMYIFCVCG